MFFNLLFLIFVKIRPLMDGNLKLIEFKKGVEVKIRPLMDGNYSLGGAVEKCGNVKIRPLMDGNYNKMETQYYLEQLKSDH